MQIRESERALFINTPTNITGACVQVSIVRFTVRCLATGEFGAKWSMVVRAVVRFAPCLIFYSLFFFVPNRHMLRFVLPYETPFSLSA